MSEEKKMSEAKKMSEEKIQSAINPASIDPSTKDA